MTHSYLPLTVNLNHQAVLVVGAGKVATSRIEKLIYTGAIIEVIAPVADNKIKQWHQLQQLNWHQKEYESFDLSRYRLVLIATDDSHCNHQVLNDAQQAKCLVNATFDGSQGDVLFPAVIDRGLFQLSLSSQGVTPTLTKLLRGWIEARLPFGVATLADFAKNNAATVKKQLPEVRQRKQFWENLFHGLAGQKLLSGQLLSLEQAKSLQTEKLNVAGEVYLVGAGPGDPELLTFKALRLMQQADVVLYDRLVADEILSLVPADARKINVGKARDKHTLPQGGINDLLVAEAKKGLRVLRLKGGDPFIFGRGGEEIEQLFDNGIRFEVVPGVTAASGCSSYAGIPLTHRDYSQSVRFITGHLKDGSADLPWHEYQYDNQTLVFYMGLHALEQICHQLILAGKSKSTPIALVQKGTTKDQKVWCSTLEGIKNDIDIKVVRAPTLIIIGEVVNLRNKLKWRD